MSKLKNIVLVICCLIVNSFAESCITPNSKAYGNCRNLDQCASLTDTLQRRFNLKVDYPWRTGTHSTQMTNFLKKYQNLCKNNKVFMKY